MKLLERLNTFKSNHMVSFHVPGHKYHPDVLKYYDDLLHMDVTEFSGTDDLHDPEDVIKESQRLAAEYYGSKAAFYLVNGTTAGIYAMLTGSLNPGDTVLIARDCHRAVYDGLFLGQLKGKFLRTEQHDYGFSMGITLETFKKGLEDNPNAKALVLTYPNYYGVCCDLKQIIDYAHKNEILVLVDAAHGAHLKLSDDLPKCPIILGADIVVQSSHKSLPALTQASMLHLNTDKVVLKKLKHMLKLYQTSSPSYLLMASLDIALEIIQYSGEERMGNLINNIQDFKSNHPYFLDHSDLNMGFSLDPTKMTLIGKKSNIDPMDFERQLRNHNIQIEFSNENNGVLVTSLMNEKSDFDYLSKTMEMLEFKCYSGIDNNLELSNYSNKLTVYETYYTDGKLMNLKDAEGKISKDFIIPYPPGIPLIVPGDLITGEHIKAIENMMQRKINVLGFKNNDFGAVQIEVLK